MSGRSASSARGARHQALLADQSPLTVAKAFSCDVMIALGALGIKRPSRTRRRRANTFSCDVVIALT